MRGEKGLARIAGLLYLAVAALGGWAHSAGGALYVADDAAATAANVAANEVLVRWVVVADILMAIAFVALGFALRQLLHADGARLASAIVTATAVSAGTLLLPLAFLVGAARAATDSGYADALGPAGRDALVLLLLDLQHTGSLLNGVFFGLWLVPVGLLAYRSARFPRAIGVIVIVGSVSWLLGTVLAFALPAPLVGLTVVTLTISTVAEIVLLLWLLVVGVRTPRKALA